MSYYNWPKIVSNLSDKDLLKILDSFQSEPKEKVDSAREELKIRGIDVSDFEKRKEIYNRSSPVNIYAGFWLRLYSILLDFLILLPLNFIVLLLNSYSKDMYFVTLAPNILIILWYQVYLVKRFGGTPGKLIVGIKVLKLNLQPISWKEAILRYSVLFGLTIYGLIVTISSLKNADSQIYNNLGWLQKQQYLVFLSPIMFRIYTWSSNIWVYSELIVLLTNEKKRALHDYIAGTVIVNNNTFNKLNYQSIEQNSQPLTLP
jgi:uncharacterized RDD family membrane protein YckC